MKPSNIVLAVIVVGFLVTVAFIIGRRCERQKQAVTTQQYFKMLGTVERDSQLKLLTRLKLGSTRDEMIRDLDTFTLSCANATADIRLITIALSKGLATETGPWHSNIVDNIQHELDNF